MNPHYFDFDPSGEAWLDRAREQLKRFDEGYAEGLFYAAFALRMGIEGRLDEYIKAAGPEKARNNGDWSYRMRLREKDPPSRSLLDVRDWLEEVALELDKATQGDLLAVRGSMFEGLFNN